MEKIIARLEKVINADLDPTQKRTIEQLVLTNNALRSIVSLIKIYLDDLPTIPLDMVDELELYRDKYVAITKSNVDRLKKEAEEAEKLLAKHKQEDKAISDEIDAIFKKHKKV